MASADDLGSERVVVDPNVLDPSGRTSIGAPNAKSTGTPTRSRIRIFRFLVSRRCPPQTATGMTGAPVSMASRVPPLL